METACKISKRQKTHQTIKIFPPDGYKGTTPGIQSVQIVVGKHHRSNADRFAYILQYSLSFNAVLDLN